MRVSEVMTGGVKTVGAYDSCYEAARLMLDQNLGYLIVTDGMSVVGVMTDRDLVADCLAAGHDYRTCTVGRHMSEPVVTIGPVAKLSDAFRTMREHEVRRLPVVEGGELVGIVSATDIMRAVESSIDERLVTLEASAPPRSSAA